MKLVSQHSTLYSPSDVVGKHLHIFLKITEYHRVDSSRHQGQSIVIYNRQAVAPL